MADNGYLSPAQQVNLFTRGLLDLVRVDVKIHQPRDLQRAMALARAYERWPAAAAPPQQSRSSRVPRRALPVLPAPMSSSTPATTASALAAPPPPKPFRRLSPTEMEERRRQGLCCNCNEQYVRGHKCPRLFYLEVTDFDVDETPTEDEQQPPPEEQLLISLHAIKIGIHEFTALLDTGSTSNFFSLATARKIGLVFQSSPDTQVVLANADRVDCQGLATNAPINISHEQFGIDSYSIPLDHFDIVLGINFLRKLGPILWDLDSLWMTFWCQGKLVLWKGIGSIMTSPQQPGDLHSIRTEEQEILHRLLSMYKDVFATPAGLPPARDCDHRIHLKPNVEPMSVRPYRYPQTQKAELDKQCEEELQQGIIRPITSPFSTPVLLVKKPDGTWHFCVDYRAMNASTAKDKFPSPVVEELLDELRGARFFTKLDLKSRYHQVHVHPDDIAKTAFSHTPWTFRVFGHALWTVQRASNIPSPDELCAETIPSLLCARVFRQHSHLQ